jgi:hypothetical protein
VPSHAAAATHRPIAAAPKAFFFVMFCPFVVFLLGAASNVTLAAPLRESVRPSSLVDGILTRGAPRGSHPSGLVLFPAMPLLLLILFNVARRKPGQAARAAPGS